jgi:hypothetical protein
MRDSYWAASGIVNGLWVTLLSAMVRLVISYANAQARNPIRADTSLAWQISGRIRILGIGAYFSHKYVKRSGFGL